MSADVREPVSGDTLLERQSAGVCLRCGISKLALDPATGRRPKVCDGCLRTDKQREQARKRAHGRAGR